MNSTLNMFLLFFIVIALVIATYTIGDTPELAVERQALKETLSRPIFSLPVDSAKASASFSYLQRNSGIDNPNLTA